MAEKLQGLSLFDIESLALSGYIKNAKIEKCSKNKFKIVATSVEGKPLTSVCEESFKVKKSFIVVVNYLNWNKKIIMQQPATGASKW